MRDTLSPSAGVLLAGALALGWSAPAHALPWNIDLVDSDAVKAYEAVMAPVPQGIASQPHALTPVAWRKNYAWTDPSRAELTNPLDVGSADVLAQGERMYGIYCTPCHGMNDKLGPVWEKGMKIIPPLGGANGRLAVLADSHVYLTIRNGSMSKLMGAYGYAMTDAEIWATVAYMRAKIDNGAYAQPVAPPVEAP